MGRAFGSAASALPCTSDNAAMPSSNALGHTDVCPAVHATAVLYTYSILIVTASCFLMHSGIGHSNRHITYQDTRPSLTLCCCCPHLGYCSVAILSSRPALFKQKLRSWGCYCLRDYAAASAGAPAAAVEGWLRMSNSAAHSAAAWTPRMQSNQRNRLATVQLLAQAQSGAGLRGHHQIQTFETKPGVLSQQLNHKRPESYQHPLTTFRRVLAVSHCSLLFDQPTATPAPPPHITTHCCSAGWSRNQAGHQAGTLSVRVLSTGPS